MTGVMNTPRAIKLDKSQIAALQKANAGGPNLIKSEPSPKILIAVRQVVGKLRFGPAGKPTYKRQLLQFVSFAAMDQPRKSREAMEKWQNVS